MACSEKETALRQILGDTRIDTALSRNDEDLRSLLAQKEIFEAATEGLQSFSLDTYLLTKGDSRAKVLKEGQQIAKTLSKDVLDLLIAAVCVPYRLEP